MNIDRCYSSYQTYPIIQVLAFTKSLVYTVEDRIKSARGCAYSLMGAGLHGENGGYPRFSLSLWNTYVLPRLTYGLDVLTLSNSEIQKLNQFHKKILKAGHASPRENS